MDNHDYLVDNVNSKSPVDGDHEVDTTQMCSYQQDELTENCSYRQDDTCGDYCVDTKARYVEILYFRHFAKHCMFNGEGEKMRNKHLKNYFDVSVVVDIECGNTNEK